MKKETLKLVIIGCIMIIMWTSLMDLFIWNEEIRLTFMLGGTCGVIVLIIVSKLLSFIVDIDLD